MKSVCHHVNKEVQEFQDIVHGQDFLLLLLLLLYCLDKLYNKTIVDY